MPQTPHIERHFTASDSLRDVVLGMSDGLTGYLAARSDAEPYTIERAREIVETGAKPAAEAAELATPSPP